MKTTSKLTLFIIIVNFLLPKVNFSQDLTGYESVFNQLLNIEHNDTMSFNVNNYIFL